MSMTENTVVVTDHDFADLSIERRIIGDVADVVELPDNGTEACELLAGADAIINLRYEIDGNAIASMDRCSVIARYGIGVDNIDTEAATEHGIPVTNVPDYCLEEVATHALTLMLALGRGVTAYDASVADGAWDRGVSVPIHRFSTQTVGIIGYGAIGRELSARVDALGATVVASDPFLSAADLEDEPASLVEIETLLETADFVSVHTPLVESTRKLIDDDALARMKPSAYLVNVSRGPIVDGPAVLDALESGEIRGAGLDVFPEEPPAVDHPLRTHEQTITTPHVAWYSNEANTERRETAAETVRTVLLGGEPTHVVNDVSS